MACCGDKSGCNKRKEPLLDAAILTTAAEQGSAIISKLLEIAVAGGGIMYLFKDNPKLNELAATINTLATENQYLKKRLAETTEKNAVVADAADVTFAFGPNSAYTLTVPIGGPEHSAQLAAQLLKAASDLMPPKTAKQPIRETLPDQKFFPFVVE